MSEEAKAEGKTIDYNSEDSGLDERHEK